MVRRTFAKVRNDKSWLGSTYIVRMLRNKLYIYMSCLWHVGGTAVIYKLRSWHVPCSVSASAVIRINATFPCTRICFFHCEICTDSSHQAQNDLGMCGLPVDTWKTSPNHSMFISSFTVSHAFQATKMQCSYQSRQTSKNINATFISRVYYLIIYIAKFLHQERMVNSCSPWIRPFLMKKFPVYVDVCWV